MIIKPSGSESQGQEAACMHVYSGLCKLCPNHKLKEGLTNINSGSVESWLTRLLSSYRVTPQSMGWVSPAKLMFGRKLGATLDLLQPDLGTE